MENDSQYFRQRAAQGCSRASLVLMLLALASGVFLASDVSRTARMVLELCAGLAFAATVAEMVFAGQWRIVRSRLWLIPLALVLLPLAQLGLAALGLNLGGDAPWRGADGDILARGAVVDSAYLMMTGFFLFAAATAQLRSPARLGIVTGTLALVLVVLGIEGPRVSEQSTPGALLAAAPWGMAGHRPWISVSDTRAAGELAWFAPQPQDGSVPRRFSVGFWSGPHWGACAVALVPVLALLAARLARQASERTGGAWYRDAKGQWAVLVWGAAIALAALTTYALPLAGLAALSLGLGAAILLSPGPLRRPVTLGTGVCWLAALVGCLVSITGSGTAAVSETFRQSLSDDASLARMFWDHLAIGCGLGGGAEVWNWYRVDSADVPFEGSALLALLAESGLFGAGVLTLALILLARALREAKTGLGSEAGFVAIGLVAGVTGLIALGAVGPGPEAPAAFALGLVLLGALARSLAALPTGGCAP